MPDDQQREALRQAGQAYLSQVLDKANKGQDPFQPEPLKAREALPLQTQEEEHPEVAAFGALLNKHKPYVLMGLWVTAQASSWVLIKVWDHDKYTSQQHTLCIAARCKSHHWAHVSRVRWLGSVMVEMCRVAFTSACRFVVLEPSSQPVLSVFTTCHILLVLLLTCCIHVYHDVSNKCTCHPNKVAIHMQYCCVVCNAYE